MHIDVHRSVRLVAPAPAATPHVQRRQGHWGLRAVLVALEAFMAFTAIYGAIFVVMAMPRSYLHQGALALFSDYSIPALALGILCGGGALVALATVLLQPRLGALAAIVAGVIMIVFELVEIVVVGFTPVMMPTQPQAWLQVVFLVLGTALAILGARLWKVETGSYHLRWPEP